MGERIKPEFLLEYFSLVDEEEVVPNMPSGHHLVLQADRVKLYLHTSIVEPGDPVVIICRDANVAVIYRGDEEEWWSLGQTPVQNYRPQEMRNNCYYEFAVTVWSNVGEYKKVAPLPNWRAQLQLRDAKLP